MADAESSSPSSRTTTGKELDGALQQKPESFRNQPITAPFPREFSWWNEDCDTYVDELDEAGGERFVASHDTPDVAENNGSSGGVATTTATDSVVASNARDGDGGSTHTNTNNWLHVTSSSPERRVQYEMRYIESRRALAGIVRFGEDCEGPPGCAHGGSIASVADALTATCVFRAAERRWGWTTNLNCNYREAVPLGTPVRVEARVVELKKRKASLEWNVCSLTELDRKKEEPFRYAFGSAEFLLPRLPKE